MRNVCNSIDNSCVCVCVGTDTCAGCRYPGTSLGRSYTIGFPALYPLGFVVEAPRGKPLRGLPNRFSRRAPSGLRGNSPEWFAHLASGFHRSTDSLHFTYSYVCVGTNNFAGIYSASGPAQLPSYPIGIGCIPYELSGSSKEQA